MISKVQGKEEQGMNYYLHTEDYCLLLIFKWLGSITLNKV